jgi:hypothetical protein
MQVRTTFISATLLVLFVVASGLAQVYYEQTTVSNGFSGNMAFTSQTNVFLISSAKYETTDTKFTGSFMKHFNAKSNRAEITRLDKECFWSVDFDKKTYTETTFAQLKKMFEEMAAPAAEPEAKEEAAVDESEYEWEEPVIKVTEGGTKKINGFNCKNYILKFLTVGKHKQTGIRDTMAFVSDMWNSVVEAKAMTLIKEFDQNLGKKLGFDKPDMVMGPMLASYKEYFEKISDETQKLKGYPVQNALQMTTTNHVKAAAKTETAEPAEEESIDLSKNPVGGMLGGFGKKLAKNQMKKRSANTGAASEVFKFTVELKVLKMEDISAGKFDVPAGFKKVETPQNMGGLPEK